MKTITTFLLGLFLTFCSHERTVLEQVLEDGELRVLSFNNPTTFYEGPTGMTGFEHDLAQLFADELGVRLVPILVDDENAVIPALQVHRGHLAAAGLVASAPLKRDVRFGPTYQTISPQLVMRRGMRIPKTLNGLGDRAIEVVSGSPEAEYLYSLADTYPELIWHENAESGHAELLNSVWERLIDFTIANSNEVALTRQFYPELKVAFDVGPSRTLAWAFPLDTDDSLYVAAIHFFNKIRRSGQLAQLIERHYGHIAKFDYQGTQTFIKHASLRLPEFRATFRKAARENGLDWRLLAAIGYQESHWDPKAVSPTGVRGLMMLTQATAKQMGVSRRSDPEQSIKGGARYLVRVKSKVPKRIAEPDRTWLALAAYNVGFGHLEDARKLTDKQGGDPDKWVDVKKRLPLLSLKKWYTQTRHGYARGHEPVRYVENVRRYFDLLVWMDGKDNRKPAEHPSSVPVIDSPIF